MKQLWIGLIGLIMWSVGLAQNLEATFVGKLEGSKAFIAIVVSGSKALAYVCDSEKIAQWFSGSVVDGTVEVKIAGGEQLQVRLSPQSAVGSLMWGEQLYRFSATPAGGVAGLYRAEATINQTSYIGGWIVDQQGEQRGSVIGGGGLTATIISLDICNAQAANLGTFKPWRVVPRGGKSDKCEARQL